MYVSSISFDNDISKLFIVLRVSPNNLLLKSIAELRLQE